MSPDHIHSVPPHAKRAFCASRADLCHAAQKWLAGFGVDCGSIGDVGIEKGKLVEFVVVLEGKCQVPAQSPIHSEPRGNLGIVLEIGSQIAVAEPRVAGKLPVSGVRITQQKASKSIPGVRAGRSPKGACSFIGVCCRFRIKAEVPRALLAFIIPLPAFPYVDTKVYGVAAMLPQPVIQDGKPILMIDRVLPAAGTPTEWFPRTTPKINARQERSDIGTRLGSVKGTAGWRRGGLVKVVVLVDPKHTGGHHQSRRNRVGIRGL